MKYKIYLFGFLFIILSSHASYCMEKAKRKPNDSEKLEFRNLKPEDRHFLQNILKDESNYQLLIGGSGDRSDDPTIELMKHRGRVLNENGEKVGIIIYNKYGYVYFLYIRKNYRNKGYAKKMILDVENQLIQRNKAQKKASEKAKSLKAEVFNYNESAVRLFEQSGFSLEGKRGHLIAFAKQI